MDFNCVKISIPVQILTQDLNKILKWFNTLNLMWVKIGSMNFFIQWNVLRINGLGFEFNW